MSESTFKPRHLTTRELNHEFSKIISCTTRQECFIARARIGYKIEGKTISVLESNMLNTTIDRMIVAVDRFTADEVNSYRVGWTLAHRDCPDSQLVLNSKHVETSKNFKEFVTYGEDQAQSGGDYMLNVCFAKISSCPQ